MTSIVLGSWILWVFVGENRNGLSLLHNAWGLSWEKLNGCDDLGQREQSVKTPRFWP